MRLDYPPVLSDCAQPRIVISSKLSSAFILVSGAVMNRLIAGVAVSALVLAAGLIVTLEAASDANAASHGGFHRSAPRSAVSHQRPDMHSASRPSRRASFNTARPTTRTNTSPTTRNTVPRYNVGMVPGGTTPSPGIKTGPGSVRVNPGSIRTSSPGGLKIEPGIQYQYVPSSEEVWSGVLRTQRNFWR